MTDATAEPAASRASSEAVWRAKLQILEVTEAARRRARGRTLEQHQADRLRRTLPPELGGRRLAQHDPDAHRDDLRAAWQHLAACASLPREPVDDDERAWLHQLWSAAS